MANTGNIIVTERDTNPFSPTYNTTRTRTYEDIFKCPPVGNLNFKVKAILNGTYNGLLTIECGHAASGYNSQTLVDSEIFDRKLSIINCIIGECVSWIDSEVFFNCYQMESIYIPNTVYHIDDYAFSGCRKLTKINIPDRVQWIGRYAFDRCYDLTELVIGTGITTIGSYAFINNPSLTSITIKATTPPTLSHDVPFSNTNNCPIYVPAGSVSAYQSAEYWTVYASRIQAIPNQ